VETLFPANLLAWYGKQNIKNQVTQITDTLKNDSYLHAYHCAKLSTQHSTGSGVLIIFLLSLHTNIIAWMTSRGEEGV